MTAIATARSMVEAYAQAELELLKGKTVTFNGRSITRENLSEIRKGREYWEERLAKLLAGQGRGGVRFKVARFS